MACQQRSLRESLVLRAATFAVPMHENDQPSAFPSRGAIKNMLRIPTDEDEESSVDVDRRRPPPASWFLAGPVPSSAAEGGQVVFSPKDGTICSQGRKSLEGRESRESLQRRDGTKKLRENSTGLAGGSQSREPTRLLGELHAGWTTYCRLVRCTGTAHSAT